MIEFNQEEFENNIAECSDEHLCEIIVCYKYLNFNEPAAISSMIELSKRRDSGSVFDFESFIDNSLNELPKIDLSVPDIREFIK